MFTEGEEGADPPNMGFLFSLADFGVGALSYRWTKLDIRIVRSDACDELMNDVC